MEDKIVFWLITASTGALGLIVFFAIQQWVKGINDKFNLLFKKLDLYIDKLNELAKTEDLHDLEKRVRTIEDKMNKCPSCNAR